jgi:type I restriction enzyme S subunit
MVPSGWRSCLINELAIFHRGLTWSGDQQATEAEFGTVPVLRIPNIQDYLDTSDLRFLRGITQEQRQRYSARKDWVLMVGSNGNPARVGNCVQINDDSGYLFASYLLGVETRNLTDVTPTYLYYLLRSPAVQALISNSVQGSTGLKNINLSFLRNQRVLVPPLGEQRKIVTLLSSVDKALRAAQSVISQTCKVKAGLAHSLLTHGIGEPHLKASAIGTIPEHWALARLGETCEIFNGRASGNGGTQIRVFKTKHVYDGPLLMHQPEYAPDDRVGNIPERTYLRDGDVLTPNMAHGTIGRVAFVERAEANWTVDGQVTVIRSLDTKQVLPRYLFDYLFSSLGRRQILEREVGSIFGDLRGQTHLYPKDLASIMIPIPPLDEQVKIAGQLQSVDFFRLAEKKHVQQARVVKDGLMQDLLTGRVRVPTS